METTPGDWKRLGRYIKQRRERLRMTQQDMYAKGGPSVATIRALEGGDQAAYRNKTYSQIEDSLEWTAGSVDAILTGGEPQDRGSIPARSVDEDSPGPMAIQQLRAIARAEGRTLGEVLEYLGVDVDELQIPDDPPRDPIIAEIEADEYLTPEKKQRLIGIYLERRAEIFEAERIRRDRERRRPGA